ncbi:NAD(P)H:quinone oxidoreductase [Paenibacillus qinlingensis]|uniref:NAD(P)H dehydrogenase (Quinone) n=1 Tax=Paenibacillus qinlingensis TaxID=1837343 RepID=A0ABU1NZJ4_9BACL|nr:NAD(P)H:quinone oxidoreductase [Paenibacillus qinlingensis]MDR6552893.1 NAD(P)H dehydrogenase (quinone) [Paenibacillus qinlingensis]
MGFLDKIFGDGTKKERTQMENVKLAIIYYSSTGTNHQMANWAADGAKEAGADVRVLKIPELAPQSAIDANPVWKAHSEATKEIPTVSLGDLEWADAIIFSIPTRFGNMPGQVKQFIDSTGGLWFQGKLANKVVSAMTSAQNSHGGQEQTILSLYTSMYHWGAIVAAPGYTDPVIFASGGNPYGTSVTVDQSGKIVEDAEKSVRHQAARTIQVARAIKNGLTQNF